MQYTLLLWPHANARYQAETRNLARAELELMLRRVAPEAVATIDEASDMPCLRIDTPAPLDDRAIAVIKNHSLLYGLFERREDGALIPVTGRAEAYLGADLPAILKYKGKTNEMFLSLLINAALYSGDFWQEKRIHFFDPMCGRATAPFIALNRGWDAVGADVDKTDLKEAEKFFKRYLEYHRFKHNMTRESRTVQGGKPVPVTRFEVFTGDDGKVSTVRIDMGAPILDCASIPVRSEGRMISQPLSVNGMTVTGTAVSMGNPHFVTFDVLTDGEIDVLGPLLERPGRRTWSSRRSKTERFTSASTREARHGPWRAAPEHAPRPWRPP